MNTKQKSLRTKKTVQRRKIYVLPLCFTTALRQKPHGAQIMSLRCYGRTRRSLRITFEKVTSTRSSRNVFTDLLDYRFAPNSGSLKALFWGLLVSDQRFYLLKWLHYSTAKTLCQEFFWKKLKKFRSIFCVREKNAKVLNCEKECAIINVRQSLFVKKIR